MNPATAASEWKLFLLAALTAVFLGAALLAPAHAHDEDREEQAAQSAALGGAASDHEGMGGMMMKRNDRSTMSAPERLLDWLGRLHPIIVHFPVAFFPAALFTAVVGRKRPAFAAPVQFLVVGGGIIAPISALLGWFNAGFGWAEDDLLLSMHRWLGTGVGLGGLLLAIWAWRRPWEDRGAGMILALTAMTAAIVAQGWFGGALVHGIEHLNW